jgi:hypothetical protein
VAWANETHFEPHKAATTGDLALALDQLKVAHNVKSGKLLSYKTLFKELVKLNASIDSRLARKKGTVTRRELAVLLDQMVKPFDQALLLK